MSIINAVDTAQFCDNALWMRGLDDVCRQFIESIPAEVRATWDVIRIVEATEKLPPRDGVVYAIFIRDRRDRVWISVPISEELLADSVPGIALSLATRADHEWNTRTVPG